MSAHSANTAVLIPISFDEVLVEVGQTRRLCWQWQKEAFWRDYMAGSRRKPDIEGLSKSPRKLVLPTNSPPNKKEELKGTRMLTSGSAPSGPHENREHRQLPRNRG